MSLHIYSVTDPEFAPYGRVVDGYDYTELLATLEKVSPFPEDAVIYVPGNDELEALAVKKDLENNCYGGMPIQIGYCNGRNTTYNGFEYHKGSEINIAITDFMLVLGHNYDICHNTYDVSQATVFFVPKGTAIEMYQTTLHLSPLRVTDEGFKDIVILPRGTNTPLSQAEKQAKQQTGDEEAILLLQRNKWVIAHPDREPLMKQGAHGGVTGENKELFYPKE